MIVYHGHASRNSLNKCRKKAPSFTHGSEYSIQKGVSKPYIVDNGAYAAYQNDEEWDKKRFVEMLEWAEERDTRPDFVVVPDVVGDAEATYERSREWVGKIPFRTYQPVQDGMDVAEAIEFARNTGSEGIFLGGTKEWKRRTARKWIKACHMAGLKLHMARPGNLIDAYRLGADSVDTVSIVRNQSWGKLRDLENHTTIERWCK